MCAWRPWTLWSESPETSMRAPARAHIMPRPIASFLALGFTAYIVRVRLSVMLVCKGSLRHSSGPSRSATCDRTCLAACLTG